MTTLDTAVPDKILERIQKLLNLAAKSTNEGEAANATAMAQELLVKYNLDAAVVQGADVGSGARERAAVDGGFFQHERDLWEEVAKLNFCLHWNQIYWTKRWVQGHDRWTGKHYREFRKAKTYRHALVGRKVNVAATRAMATYLAEIIDRLTKEKIRGAGDYAFANWATSFRKGVTARVCQRLRAKRNEILAAEEVRRTAEERASDNVSTSSALTLMVYIDKETDANMDFVYGEGWSAKRAAAAAEARAEREAYTRWAAEHPEEAAAEEAQRRKQAGRARGGGGRSQRDNVDRSAYWSGYDAAGNVSLDQQMDKSTPAGLL